MITDHVAILTHAALAKPVQNRKKAAKPMEYYAVIAFPPSAGQDLADLARGVAPGGNLTGQRISVKPNSQKAKPIPGIPGDWLIVRAATQFAPQVYDIHGKMLEQETAASQIQAKFYAGKKIRAAVTAFAWPDKGEGPGISYNLAGVMEVADGERLNIGNGDVASAFGKYAQPGESAPATGTQGNPFGAQGGSPPGTPTAQAGGDNPFAQAGSAGSALNPFGGA